MQQSRTPLPSQQIAEKEFNMSSKNAGDEGSIQPDLSHLTPEERRIIEDVIDRQRQEELIDRSFSTPVCRVVQRGSKLFQRLPTLTDASPSAAGASSYTSNAQLSNSIRGPIARTKDEFFGGVTRRNLGTDRSFPLVRHNRTSGDLFGAVSNFFTRTGSGGSDGSDICEICHVTKFTGNAGHKCAQCNLKTCVRCGGWFGTQSSWMCKNCFSNLSTPPPVSYGVKEPPMSTPSHPIEPPSSSNPNPTLNSKINKMSTSSAEPDTNVGSTNTSTASNMGPVERSLSGYAGVASRTRLRKALREHRSVSEEERVWTHYQPTPSSHCRPHLPVSRQPPQDYYSHSHTHPQRQQSYSSSIPPRYLHQNSSQYPTTQYSYNPPQLNFRHSTGPPVGRGNRRSFGEMAWTQPVVPPKPRFEHHPLRGVDGGEESSEGSPHAGFQAEYMRRGGGQTDPGSVSEPCQSEVFLREDYHKSFTAERRMYQHSVDVDCPSTSRSALWSPSQDGESLIGQVYLRKSRATSEIGLLSSFGLKLVIGKRVPSDLVGTFVSSVKEGSVADAMGELQIGDEILEWNGHNLRGLHQEEVSEILALSRNTDEVWLTVQRIVDEYYEEPDDDISTSFSRPDEESKFQAEEEEVETYGDILGRDDADPHLQLKLRYDEEKQALVVSVLAARDLPAQLDTHTGLCNSFCQITILPETSKYEPRCTRVVRKTNDPVWIHNFTFEKFVINSKELEVAVFDYRQGRTAFIGEVLISLQVADLSGRAYWYPIPPPWDTPDQDISSQVQSEGGTFEADDWSGGTSERGTVQASHRTIGDEHTLRNISPRSVPSRLSASVAVSASSGRQMWQPISGSRAPLLDERNPVQLATAQMHPSERGARFTLSEDDQSFLSDNSEASGFSSFSKLSLQSSRLHQHQRVNTGKLGSGGRRISPRFSRSRPGSRSPSQNLLAEAGEEEREDETEGMEEEMMDEPPNESERIQSPRKRNQSRPTDDQTKFSSTEDRSASSSNAAATVAANCDGNGAPNLVPAACNSDTAKSAAIAESVTASVARKRRSSIGHRFSNVLGISKKNTVASGTDKKTKASFQRSEEVLPANIHTNEKGTVSGGYKAPGAVAQGAGFGGIAASSAQSSASGGLSGSSGHHSGALQHHLGGGPRSTSTSTSSGRKDQLALEMGEVHVGEFVEGLGPGQLVGRQVLGMPCLGEIQLSFFDRKGHLEVEVIRARGLQQKNTSKPLPTPYVKLHLLEGKQSVEKMRTTAPARRTLDPLFQQQFSFSNSYKDKILQVSVWGEYGRMDKKVFLGMCEIVLEDLNLISIVFGWYKLFGMIASTAQHHKQVRRHASSSAGTSSGTPQSPATGKQRLSNSRHLRNRR